MNKQRRKELGELMDRLEAKRNAISETIETFAEVRDELSRLRDEEEEARDNLPESIQEGEQGQTMEDAIGNIDSALDAIEEAHDALDSLDLDAILSDIDDARGQA